MITTRTYCSYVQGIAINKTEIGCDSGLCKDCPYRLAQQERHKSRKAMLKEIATESGKIDKRMLKNVRTLNKDQLFELRNYIDELIERCKK